MQPFISVHVQPSYGSHTALISWSLVPTVSGDIWVYRSPDGAGDWTLVNTVPVDSSDGQFQDSEFGSRALALIPHYKLTLELANGDLLDSPIAGPFEHLTRTEFGGLSKIMKMEYMRMSRGNGLRVLHYKPRLTGPDAPTVDPLTGSIRGDASCPSDTSYGEKKAIGFRRPFLTWVELQEVGDYGADDRTDGLGTTDEQTITARFLAYPKPMPNDVIVHVPTDNRYEVKSAIVPFMFRGLMPVGYTAKMRLIPRNDPRYRIPIPDEYQTMPRP